MLPVADTVQGYPCTVRLAAVGQSQLAVLVEKIHQGERTDAVSAHEMIAHGNLHKIPAKAVRVTAKTCTMNAYRKGQAATVQALTRRPHPQSAQKGTRKESLI